MSIKTNMLTIFLFVVAALTSNSHKLLKHATHAPVEQNCGGSGCGATCN